MKRVAVLQSNYLPWKGYFDIIRNVDLFVFYDDVQFTKNDWRNRNKILTPRGLEWISVPVGQKISRLIHEVEIPNSSWQKSHYGILTQSYSKAPCFKSYKQFISSVYLEKEWKNLSELNQFLIRSISTEFLGIQTRFDDSRNYSLQGTKEERLISLLKQVGATHYLSGPAGRSYINEDFFLSCGIEVKYQDYSGYPEYPQLYSAFSHQVSIVDLLFNCGEKSSDLIWGWRENRGNS